MATSLEEDMLMPCSVNIKSSIIFTADPFGIALARVRISTMRTRAHFEILSDQKSTGIPHKKEQDVPSQNRDLRRGLWELARLHTKESWLCWYPAGQCYP